MSPEKKDNVLWWISNVMIVVLGFGLIALLNYHQQGRDEKYLSQQLQDRDCPPKGVKNE